MYFLSAKSNFYYKKVKVQFLYYKNLETITV